MAKKTKVVDKEDTSPISNDGLISDLAKAMNSKYGDLTMRTFEEGADTIDSVSTWVSSGVPLLDFVLGGKGFPAGRVSEIYGEASSGKTALAMHALKTTIDQGGYGFILDTEYAFSFEMAKIIGLNPGPNLGYIRPTCLEDMWRCVEMIIDKCKKNVGDKLVTIVVDSVAASPAEDESHDKSEMGIRARINSKALRIIIGDISDQNICLILLNQIRKNLNIGYGAPQSDTSIPGGQAIDFACSIKLRTTKGALLKENENDNKSPVVGQAIHLYCDKNKLASPFRKGTVELFFETGIHKYAGLLSKLKSEGIITVSGPWHTYAGEKFYSRDFVPFVDAHPELADVSKWKEIAKPEKEDE